VVFFLLFICTVTLYAADFNRRVSGLMFIGTDNSLVFEMRLFYDERGNLVKVKQFDHLMKLIGYEEYFYDSEGRKFRETIFDSRRAQQKYTLLQYTKNKRTATSYTMDDKVIMIIETEYDPGGAVKRIVEYSADREIAAVSTYSYGRNGYIKCSRDLPVEGLDFYYIIKLDRDGMLESVDYHKLNGERAGYVRIISEDGIMTRQSLNDIIF
jgi:hypothetical protein